MAGVNSHSGSIYTQYLDAEFIAVNSRFLYKEKIPTEFLYRSVRIFFRKGSVEFSSFLITSQQTPIHLPWRTISRV